MKNKSTLICSAQANNAKQAGISQGLKLTPLTRSIREIITLGGLAFATSGVWAEVQINPNEVWFNPGELKGICVLDIDQDGDMDLFSIYNSVVYMLENTGTPEFPEFTHSRLFLNDTGNFTLNQFGLTDCRYYDNDSSAFIDIDDDGDLDLFKNSSGKPPYSRGESLVYSRNDGTTGNPVFVNLEGSEDRFGLPIKSSPYAGFMFRDIDNDGDEDFFIGFPNTYYENTGTSQNAVFIKRDDSPLPSVCENDVGFLVDLNNDAQWDIICRRIDNNNFGFENSFDYVESNLSEYLPKINLVNIKSDTRIGFANTVDIDDDGDLDIITSSCCDSDFMLFTNFSSSSLPQFSTGNEYPNLFPQSYGEFTLTDYTGDGNFDHISDELRAGSINTGTNLNPLFEQSSLTLFEQCKNGFSQIADTNKRDPASTTSFDVADIALIDIDGDDDLDLFARLFIDDSVVQLPRLKINAYCENVGNVTNPLFAPGTTNTFGLNVIPNTENRTLLFSDMDGDGDYDAWNGQTFYDNVGNPKEPLFRALDNLIFTSGLDLDGNSRIESYYIRSHSDVIGLAYNGLEPATEIDSTFLPYASGTIVIATNRPSQVQLQTCSSFRSSRCEEPIILPATANQISLSSGDFTGNGQEEIVLAMIDVNGLLKIKLYNADLELIGTGAGGPADSVSVSAGQLDDDPADEYVVSLVQSDGRVAAIAFNLNGSRVGKVVANKGKQPSVDVGNFGGTGDGYVLAYLTPENQLETAVFKGDGTLLGQGSGGQASHIRVSTAEISSTYPGDEYAISLVQADGTVALIAYAADGTRLGKVAGGISHQPKVISGKSGLAASVILSDKKPAIIFLDNQGKHLGTGVGGVTASISTIELLDANEDGIDDSGVLVYIDEAGNPRIGVYDLDGKRK